MGSSEGAEDCTGGNEEKIFVSVRLRPLNVKEIYRNDVSEWECISDDTVVFKNVCLSASERSMYPTVYTFDRVFKSDCSTREVYEKGAKEVAISVLHGINSTVFAYGQTSSGKTYTMTGVTEFALADIYDYIRKNPDREFVLKFSAMEIYNESVRDLLSMDTTPLRLLDDPERGTIVERLTEEVLSDWNHVIHLLSICEAQRQIGETSLNEMSSRSHQIIRLTIESSTQEFLRRDNSSNLSATVNFVDLAGSERASQSLSAGARLKEGCHINRSLLTLGTVIRKLSKARGGHIPFRDSKLTRILQSSLGGNARTAIICTMSPARSHVEQSRNTLLFACCAKEVTTNARVNVVMSDKSLVKYLQSKVERLEDELRSYQSTYIKTNFSALVREKDIHIEKLEGEIHDLILQRDIAQSKVKDLLQILGDYARSGEQAGFVHYPQLRIRRSPDKNIAEQATTSHLEDPCSSVVNTQAYSDGQSETTSAAKVSFVVNEEPTRMSASSSSISESYSFNGWDETEKHSDGASDDMCKEVHCVETVEGDEFSSEENNEIVLESPLSQKSNNFGETSEAKGKEIIPENQEPEPESAPAPVKEEKESLAPQCFTQILKTPAVNPPLKNEVDIGDLSGCGSFKLSRSKSCKASIVDSASSLFKMESSESTSSPLIFRNSYFQSSAAKKLSPGNAHETEVQSPSLTLWSVDDDIVESINVTEEKTDAEEINAEKQLIQPAKKNVRDVSLDPIKDDGVEFRILQQEIIQLWHDCKVSLIHRTYFFLLFQGDPSDSLYLEVEQRRMKFLKIKFSQGERVVVNRQAISLASSEKSLHEERKMLSRKMMKKVSEAERKNLFVKWGINLKSKRRRLQLAQRLWTKPDETDHVSESAALVAKLTGFVAPGKKDPSPSKEMLGLDFTSSRWSSRAFSFRHGLVPFM